MLQDVFERHGGHEIEVSADSAHRVISDREGSRGCGCRRPAHRAAASLAAWARPRDQRWCPFGHGRDRLDRAAIVMCAELCDVAEGGEIFLSQVAAGLLEEAGLGELSIKDVGKPTTRRGGSPSARSSSSIRDEFSAPVAS